MSTMRELKTDGELVLRNDFEKELLRILKAPGQGWNGTFAMVTLGVMFMARSISDVGISIKELAEVQRRGHGISHR